MADKKESSKPLDLYIPFLILLAVSTYYIEPRAIRFPFVAPFFMGCFVFGMMWRDFCLETPLPLYRFDNPAAGLFLGGLAFLTVCLSSPVVSWKFIGIGVGSLLALTAVYEHFRERISLWYDTWFPAPIEAIARDLRHGDLEKRRIAFFLLMQHPLPNGNKAELLRSMFLKPDTNLDRQLQGFLVIALKKLGRSSYPILVQLIGANRSYDSIIAEVLFQEGPEVIPSVIEGLGALAPLDTPNIDFEEYRMIFLMDLLKRFCPEELPQIRAARHHRNPQISQPIQALIEEVERDI